MSDNDTKEMINWISNERQPVWEEEDIEVRTARRLADVTIQRLRMGC